MADWDLLIQSNLKTPLSSFGSSLGGMTQRTGGWFLSDSDASLAYPARHTQCNSSMHRYECVVLCKDISLQRGQFCTKSLASCIPRSSEDRSSRMFFLQVVCGRPGGRLQSAGEIIIIPLHTHVHTHTQHLRISYSVLTHWPLILVTITDAATTPVDKRVASL